MLRQHIPHCTIQSEGWVSINVSVTVAAGTGQVLSLVYMDAHVHPPLN